ncbi:MAG: uroporphyrinogen-III C-methyltransferase [Rhodobacteraceae bacterium]|nr:uroporphyrinogen-III C-methyltransferase [Paracoccaceae bacterium]
MKHFPIFLNVAGQRIVLAGGSEAALAKLRLLLKTEAQIEVFAKSPDPQITQWAAEGRLVLTRRALVAGDVIGAALFYAASEDDGEDARTAAIARAEGALVNMVDNLADSQFITPAIVDRDPVTVAIGTEGAAPVLARAIKADLEERLPPSLGRLTQIGQAFRQAAMALPFGRARRDFWADYFFRTGPRALEQGEVAAADALPELLNAHLNTEARDGHVIFVGAGPGDPELLTLKARTALDRADVVIHDGLVAPEILELARREATLIAVGKTGFGKSTPQGDINAAMVENAAKGLEVVRLKSGDPAVFGRLDEEIEALTAAGIAFSIISGLTAASAAAATMGQSLTQRGRNSAARLITAHDTKGYAEQDWRALARPGEVAAIYMGKRAARFVQGRLLMHGADPATPVGIVENASRPDERVISTTLAALPGTLNAANLTGPAVIMLGLARRLETANQRTA